MRIKTYISEDFVNYKKPSMFIGTCFCDWKCDKDADCKVCQNSSHYHTAILNVADEAFKQAYDANPLTCAIVFGGYEPFCQYEELLAFIDFFRTFHDDDIVIYTGYNKDEIAEKICALQKYPNIIIKFGRFIPNQPKHYDDVLGVYLASNNQYAEKIS